MAGGMLIRIGGPVSCRRKTGFALWRQFAAAKKIWRRMSGRPKSRGGRQVELRSTSTSNAQRPTPNAERPMAERVDSIVSQTEHFGSLARVAQRYSRGLI